MQHAAWKWKLKFPPESCWLNCEWSKLDPQLRGWDIKQTWTSTCTAASGPFFLKPTGLVVKTWNCSHVYGENVNSTAKFCECHPGAGCHVIYECGPNFFGLLLAGLRHESSQHILHRTCALTTKSQASVFSGNWHYGYAEWPVFRGMKILLGKCFLFGFVWWLHLEDSVLQEACFTSMPFLCVDDCIRGIDLQQSDLFQAVC